MPYRISTDIGGTFTDLVLADEQVLVGHWKSPTTPRDLAGGVFDCLELVARDLGLSLRALLRGTELFVHGSTVATNTILEGKGEVGTDEGLPALVGWYLMWKKQVTRPKFPALLFLQSLMCLGCSTQPASCSWCTR